MHLHGDSHQHPVVHEDCSHHDYVHESKACDLESEQDCCYENAHLFLAAAEILDCRAGELQSVHVPVVVFEEASIEYDSLKMTDVRHAVSHLRNAHCFEQLKTVVLRV